jgi:ferritin-like protein
LKSIKWPNGEKLAEGIKKLFAREPEREWRNHIEAVASRIKDEGEP